MKIVKLRYKHSTGIPESGTQDPRWDPAGHGSLSGTLDVGP